MKVKRSKFKVILVLLTIGVLTSFRIFVIAPLIDEIYFSDDVSNFEESSWKYSFILASIIVTILLFYAVKRKLEKRKLFIYSIVLFFLITFSFKRSTDGLLLYFNSKIKVEKYTKNYVVIRYDPNKVFHIYDRNTEFITFDDQLSKINAIRLKRKLKSLYSLQNKDTLNIEYKIGFLKVKYLE